MAKFRLRLIVLHLGAVLCIAGNAYCQISAPSRAALSAAIETELSKSPDHRFLYEHADAYNRLVHLRALKSLGYDLRKIQSARIAIQSFGAADTGSVKDITDNEADQNETSIVINRKNPNLIIAGANDTRMYYSGMSVFTSEDQGKNWSTHFIATPIDSLYPVPLGDPATAADNAGNFYYAYLAGDDTYERDNVVVAISSDGKNWTNGRYIIAPGNSGGFEDKEQIAIDNNPESPYYGRVYVVWMHFDSPVSSTLGGARLAWSDDGCKSWSKIKNLTNNGISEFSQVKTGKYGEVIITFSIPNFSTGEGKHVMLVSQDGGKSFTTSEVAQYTDYPTNNYHREGLKGHFGFRCFPYIAEDIDLRDNRIHLVYATWEQQINPQCAASVLYYTSSQDLGKSWSIPKPVGIANPLYCSLSVDRFCPWVSVNQKTGDAFTLYYSSENDTNNLLVSTYRTKLSESMMDYPRRIGDRDFDGTLIAEERGDPPFIGDYIGSDLFDTVYAAAWTENREGYFDGDIYASITTNEADIGSVVIHSENLWLGAPSPNPVAGGPISLRYYFPQKTAYILSIYSISGSRIGILSEGESDAGTYTKEYIIKGIASGEYFIRLSSSYGSAEKKLVVVK